MSPEPQTPQKKPSRLEALLAEYGPSVMVTYFGMAAITYAALWIALSRGLNWMGVEIGEGPWALAFAAWVGLKATQPVRIGATLLLVPVTARLWGRLRG